jgi:hypothetical protein
MEVKWEVSEPVGERMPAGRFSLESPPSIGGALLRWSVPVIAAAGPIGNGDSEGGEWFTIVGIG